MAGNGPCNAQRVAQRKAAHSGGAWVREAAAAHAAKQAGRAGGRGMSADTSPETSTGQEGRASWPLCEVFIRGKRGLNHVHVGSLHAADGEMALRNARDLYTRRNEGVSIWVVAVRGDHRVQPGREGSVLRAVRRQGVPAPDLLRHPRQRAAHVSAAMSFDNAYEALNEGTDASDAHSDAHWAFGTGFADPLAGVDTTVPADADAADLALYSLMLGDDALIMSHRLQEWCTSAPELEDEVALANIALDLLGQARLLLSRAAAAEAGGEASSVRGETSSVRGEDRYAFFRSEDEFRNVRLAELERGDFGELTARLLVFAIWRLALLQRLAASTRSGARGGRGQGRQGGHLPPGLRRAVAGPAGRRDRVLPCAGRRRAGGGLAVRGRAVRRARGGAAAGRRRGGRGPGRAAGRIRRGARAGAGGGDAGRAAGSAAGRGGGRDGVHTEAMGGLLAELQSVARADPEATW